MRYNERGHEILDPTPVEMPVRFQRPPTLQEQIKAFVKRELSEAAEAQGVETFEEADDFDIEDDPIDPTTPWELNYEQERASREMPDADAERVASSAGSDLGEGSGQPGTTGAVAPAPAGTAGPVASAA